MHIEIVAIGDEVLKGHAVNTNAAFLSQQLKRLGYSVARHLVLPDRVEVIASALQESLARSSLVITTGGLGPTLDDLTKRVLAKLFDSELVFNEAVAQDLEQRFANLSSKEEQSTLPEKAQLVRNKIGTAPGFIFSQGEKILIALPGIPREMEAMFLSEVIPFMEKQFPLKEKLYMEELYLAALPENPVDTFLQSFPKDPLVEIGIYPGYGLLQVAFTTYAKSAAEAKKRLRVWKERICAQFAEHIYLSENGKIEQAVQAAFLERKKTLALAESCTGGAIAARICSIPDASQFFLGSIVSYANAMKRDLLRVSENTLQERGAVSREAVREMAEGLFAVTTADYVLAISGIAGPSGGTLEKPVGTIYLAVGCRGEKIEAGRIYCRAKSRASIGERGSFFPMEAHCPS